MYLISKTYVTNLLWTVMLIMTMLMCDLLIVVEPWPTSVVASWPRCSVNFEFGHCMCALAGLLNPSKAFCWKHTTHNFLVLCVAVFSSESTAEREGWQNCWSHKAVAGDRRRIRGELIVLLLVNALVRALENFPIFSCALFDYFSEHCWSINATSGGNYDGLCLPGRGRRIDFLFLKISLIDSDMSL